LNIHPSGFWASQAADKLHFLPVILAQPFDVVILAQPSVVVILAQPSVVVILAQPESP
jgi:hypothetical protein